MAMSFKLSTKIHLNPRAHSWKLVEQAKDAGHDVGKAGGVVAQADQTLLDCLLVVGQQNQSQPTTMSRSELQ